MTTHSEMVLDVRAVGADRVEVRRKDGRRMDFAAAFLYTNRQAGCGTYFLWFDGDGEHWKDMTDKTGSLGGASLVNQDATSQTYAFPRTNGAGEYLLCMPDDTHHHEDVDLCGLLKN